MSDGDTDCLTSSYDTDTDTSLYLLCDSEGATLSDTLYALETDSEEDSDTDTDTGTDEDTDTDTEDEGEESTVKLKKGGGRFYLDCSSTKI